MTTAKLQSAHRVPEHATRPSDMNSVLTFPERNLVLWISGSVLLGVILSESGAVSTLHALVVLGIGSALAIWGRRLPAILATMAYVGISDVLWRSTGAMTPWEGPKYFLLVVAVLATIRFVHGPRRIATPLLLAICLAPALLATILSLPFAVARDVVSFALLGPAVLIATTVLFRQIIVSRDELRGILWWAISPCISVGAMAGWGTIRAEEIDFGSESLFVTAGGFGPNQVSSIIGLGALLAIGIALLGGSLKVQLSAAGIGITLIAQGLITLSRGGIYAFALAAIAILLTTIILKGNRSRGVVVLVIASFLALLALNWAQGFSGGAVANRFDQDDSGRSKIVAAETRLFRENPTLGVGAGQSRFERQAEGATLGDAASHNEYSRLLAEHGLLGAAAIALLIAMGIQAFIHGTDTINRSLSVGFIVWAAASMSHSATRLCAVGLIFGLAAIRTEPDGPPLLSHP